MRTRAVVPLVCVCALGVAACGPSLSQPAPPPDCNAGDGYTVSNVFLDGTALSDGLGPSDGFDFADSTPNSTLFWGGLSVDGSQTCGRTRVLDMQCFHHNDYGGSFFFVMSGFGSSAGVDASQATGISFWARSPDAADDKGATIFLTDDTTDPLAKKCTIPTAVDELVTVSAGDGGVTVTTDDPGAGTQMGTNASQTPGFAYKPTDCYNDFQYVIRFTNTWTLYQIPFNQFYQQQWVNWEPNGLHTSSLWEFYFRIPKEAHFELWIDQIGFYRATSATAGP